MGWMDGWMDGWVGYFSLWATSSLSDLFLLRHLFSQLLLFSEQPLNWATSALTCLPDSSSVASATQVFSSLSFDNAFSNLQPPAAIPQEYHYGRYNAFSNLQLQSRLPGASQHQMLSCAEPCQCVLSQPAANPHGIAGASRQLDQRSRSADNGTSATQIRGCSERDTFFAMFFWNRALATVSCTFCRPHVPKVLQTPQFDFCVKSSFRHVLCTFCRPHLPKVPRGRQFFNILKRKPSPRYSPVRFLSTTLPNRGPQPRKQRPYFGKHRSHFTLKNTGIHARECFHLWVHTLPNCYTSQLLMMGGWHDDVVWCGWHDGGNADHDYRP